MIHFKNITEDNFDAVINMKRPEGENYLASNEYSLAQHGFTEKQMMSIRLPFMKTIFRLDL